MGDLKSELAKVSLRLPLHFIQDWAPEPFSCQEFPAEADAAISGALKQALDALVADEGVPTNDLVCDRDYSRQCPEGGSVRFQRVAS